MLFSPWAHRPSSNQPNIGAMRDIAIVCFHLAACCGDHLQESEEGEPAADQEELILVGAVPASAVMFADVPCQCRCMVVTSRKLCRYFTGSQRGSKDMCDVWQDNRECWSYVQGSPDGI